MPYDVDSPEWHALQAAASRVADRVERDGFGALTEDERTFFLVWIAEGEVGNGGMHAVCYNSTGDYLRWLPQAFKAVGASRKAAAFGRLIEAFGPAGPSADHAERIQQHQALSADSVATINALDEVFFSAPEPVDEPLYVLSNRLTVVGNGA